MDSIFNQITQSPEHLAIWYCENTYCTECRASYEFQCEVRKLGGEMSHPDSDNVKKTAMYKYLTSTTHK